MSEEVLSKEEISNVFLLGSKYSQSSSEVHCHISTLDNDPESSGDSINLDYDSFTKECRTPEFYPEPKVKTKPKEKFEDLLICENFVPESPPEKTADLNELIDKLAQITKKYEKNPVDEEFGAKEERKEGEEERKGMKIEEKKEGNGEESRVGAKMQFKKETKSCISNSLTRIAKDKQKEKKSVGLKTSQTACARCLIV